MLIFGLRNSLTSPYNFEHLRLLEYILEACPSKNLEKVWDIEIFCNIAKFRKMKAKNDKVPIFFYVPNFFYVFFRKT